MPTELGLVACLHLIVCFGCSKKGLKILSDKDKMKEVNRKIFSIDKTQINEDVVI